MKFDVVIGNPPYQKGKDKRLYQDFIKIGERRSNEVCALIVPRTWMNDSPLWIRHKNTYSFTHINVDECAKHFININDTLRFSYFIYKKTSYNRPVELTFSDYKTTLNQNQIINPTKMSDYGRDYDFVERIFGKLGKFGYIQFIVGKGQHEYKKEGKYEVWLSSKKDRRCLYSDKTPEDYGRLKLIVSHIICPGKSNWFSEISRKGAGRYSFYYCNEDKVFLNNLRNFFDGTIYRFIDKYKRNKRYSSFDIPNIDFNKHWTNEQIYEHFNLTQEEISYIEKIV